ncbi:M23 family metallopeptidase [Metabacillus sediminilitoris]|uniref:M23 family peptidase n=1 Tax=Metabacillus sediminilitoris TaxID=2567941 RepID=A0A4S4BQE2_9BACI|nr:M23 family metallopeptidase [Metabacillus sediminilitoris]QGQ48326.1 peptidoglycan DD-metalloendopeptidase family protein [Metabacillus sediminilitoris]THF76982.1 M23 family peptidase [Metabacillus sediminilitoris]
MREEEKKRTSQNSKIQQFFRKRWVFPAIYLMSAAVILTAVLWYQSISNNVAEDLNTSEEDAMNDPEAVEVNALKENVAMPALDPDAVNVVKKFYDPNASTEDQEAALVFYDNSYRMNKGIDIAKEDQTEFDVVASLSGTVTKAEKDPILGYVVEIEHENDLVTVYQSLAEASVQAGDKVEQKELIGKAGKNLFNEEDGIHVHFEIRQNGTAINPLTFMDKPVTSIEEATQEEAANEEMIQEEAETSEEAPKEDAEAPKEDTGSETEESPEAEKDAEKGETEGAEQSSEPEASNQSLNS